MEFKKRLSSAGEVSNLALSILWIIVKSTRVLVIFLDSRGRGERELALTAALNLPPFRLKGRPIPICGEFLFLPYLLGLKQYYNPRTGIMERILVSVIPN